MAKSKAGRPKKDLDEKFFEALCRIQCTKVEMCAVFEVDEKTITRWCKEIYGKSFEDTYQMFSHEGKMSLRRLQFEHAKTNPGMAMFLGKVYLGQSDRADLNIKSDNDLNINIKMVE
jgi:hypothetical protein